MLRNYLRVAWRNFKRHPIYTCISIVGLGVAMASCLLIALYIQDELSYNTFHPDANRTVVMATDSKMADSGFSMGAPGGLRELMASKIPGVRQATRARVYSATVRHEGKRETVTQRSRALAADSSFFDVLSGFQVRGGSASDVLDAPNEMMITASAAQNLFGEADPIGKALTVGIKRRLKDQDISRRYTVVGVTEVPAQSTLKFDVIIPEASTSPDKARSWSNQTYRVYARVGEGVHPDSLGASVEAALPAFVKENYVESVRAIPLPDIYLSEVYESTRFEFKGNPRYLYFFGVVAILILLIASANYVNLVTAQAEQRAREVGIRKAVGAQRGQIAQRFLCESILLSLLALGAAIALVSIVLPAFNAVFRVDIDLATARYGWALITGAGIVLAISLLASTYPALVLSGRRATTILRGASTTTSGGGGWLRKGLIVAQFTVSAGLVFGTTVMYQQLGYLQSKDLGFDGEQVITAQLGDLSPTRQQAIRRKALSHPDVKQASVSDAVPGQLGQFGRDVEPSALSPEAKVREDGTIRRIYRVRLDTNYVETLGLNIIAGRRFTGVSPGERKDGYVLNEAAVRALGWSPETAVGKPFKFDREGQVIGVVENFHVQSLRSPIRPVVLTLKNAARPSRLPLDNVIAARLEPGGIQAAMEHVRQVVEEMSAKQSFRYAFLDEQFDRMYRTAERLGRIFAGFAGIAIVLACMGLFGLAAYATQRRTREIGIRKALGASASRIARLLFREYAALVALALGAGFPFAYLVVRQWLQDFAYQIDVGVGTFMLAAGLVLLIAGASVGYHALRAAWTDPATAIRQE